MRFKQALMRSINLRPMLESKFRRRWYKTGMYSTRSRRKTMKQLGTTAQKFAVLAMGIGFTFALTAMADVDVEAAKALARQNNCFKCHAVEKEKDGPSYKKVAEKYKGKDNAEARLMEHITSGEKAKFPDGHEEEHKIIQTSPPNDKAQIKNLVDWVLSQ
jgi:cytochrome c